MNILILPGDGIGKEICFEVEKLFKELNSIFSIDINFETSDFGGSAIKKYNNPYPTHTAENVIASDAVILGAVGGPMFDHLEGEMKPESGLLKLRKNNNLYINLRPIFSFTHAIESSPLKKEIISNLNILIIRELVGGLYFGEPRGFNSDRTEGYNTMRYTKTHINKILKFAFEVSSLRNKKLCSVDKANVLEVSQLWRSEAIELNKSYKDVVLENMYVDNAAMQLVLNPGQFDVIVTENLFGDILSDLASVLTGSIGLLSSASLNDDHFGVYEPIHGSAPDIAGKNIANPCAIILSVGLMFLHTFNRKDIYDAINNAVENTINSGTKTKDISLKGDKAATTQEMGDCIITNLRKYANEKL